VSSLQVGAARIAITPALGTRLQGHLTRSGPAIEVLDELYCRAIALEGDGVPGLIVSCDLLEFQQEFVEELRDELERRCALPPEQWLLCATHTHTGPPTIDLGTLKADRSYLGKLVERIAGAAEEAFARLESARIRYAALPGPPIGVNRRLVTGEGVRMAPNPLGPTDPQAAVIAFERPDGTALAALVQHAVHPTTLGVALHVISADYPGRACRYLEERLGGDPTVLFAQGACGDVRPAVMDAAGSFREGFERDIEEIGGRLGAAFLESWGVAAPLVPVPLRGRLRSLELPLSARPTVAELERQREQSLRLAARDVQAAPAGRTDPWEERHMDPRGLHQAVAEWATRMIAQAEQGVLPRRVRGNLQALAFGRELVLVGFPGELFCEIGMRIKAESPFRHTVVCGYTGGSVGYVPTRRAMAEGGYEVSEAYKLYGLPSVFREDVEELVCREVGSLLAGLHEESSSPRRA